MDLVGAVPRSVWFNFRWLPWGQALKLPVWIAPNVRVKSMWRGGMVLADARFNSCHIGFHCADAVDCYGVHTIVCVKPGGRWLVESGLHVGRGAIVNVNSAGCFAQDAILPCRALRVSFALSLYLSEMMCSSAGIRW